MAQYTELVTSAGIWTSSTWHQGDQLRGVAGQSPFDRARHDDRLLGSGSGPTEPLRGCSTSAPTPRATCTFTPHETPSGNPRFGITTSSNTGEQNLNNTAAMKVATWYHVAITLGPNGGVLYVNGTQSVASRAMTLRPMSIGIHPQRLVGHSQWTNDPYFDGEIDELHIQRRPDRRPSAVRLHAQLVPLTDRYCSRLAWSFARWLRCSSVKYATAMRPPRASPSREIHGASREHYAPAEALAAGEGEWGARAPPP